jgi:hypothetical protein
MAVDVKTERTFEAEAPRALFQTHVSLVALNAYRNHYAPSPDGQKFLMVNVPEEQSTAPLVVILNWASRR